MAWVVKRQKLNFKKVFFWNTLICNLHKWRTIFVDGNMTNIRARGNKSVFNVCIKKYVSNAWTNLCYWTNSAEENISFTTARIKCTRTTEEVRTNKIMLAMIIIIVVVLKSP